MNYTEFREELKVFPVFSTQEILKHFPEFDSRRLVEWQKRGYLKKVRNRFYYFADQEVNEHYLYHSANRIYKPSYVSLESALAWYNFIPEESFQIISCTTLKTQKFATPLGTFSYHHLRPALYFGYQIERWNNYPFVIAGPEKVLIDYLYLHSEIQGTKDLLILRWNSDEIKDRISMDTLNKFEKYINSPALSERLEILKRFLQ